jgi:stage III sporulation protein SpoIIIAA
MSSNGVNAELTTQDATRDLTEQSAATKLEATITDNLDDLLAVIPARIATSLRNRSTDVETEGLIELVLDLGRRPEARFQRGAVFLTSDEITREDLAQVEQRIGRFGDDNRAGIERTLHRISAIRNRSGDIVGLTCRVGRAVYGTIGIISDLVASGESILLLGRPGVGKTTMLREVARVLADDLQRRVVVVDTSNEIAGDGDIPHPSIGRARRMQVPTPAMQHAVMIEAVENHMPEVIVIDEIGTELEAAAARTIAERGVQLIGTAHGNTLENLMINPTLSDLIGGIQSVTLSDEEARRRGTQKSILERKAPPTFTVMVEIRERDTVAVVPDVASTVDAMLRGQPQRAQLRQRHNDGTVTVSDVDPVPSTRSDLRQTSHRDRSDRRDIAPPADESSSSDPVVQRNPLTRGRGTPSRPMRIFPFGVSRNRLEQTLQMLAIPSTIVRDVREADMVLTLKNYYRQRPPQLREAESRGVAIYVLRANTVVQMTNVLRELVNEALPDDNGVEPAGEHPSGDGDPVTSAMFEAEEAITAVLEGAAPMELRPQAPYIRRLQHQLADRYNLGSRSRGREPNRHVEIFRDGSLH